MAKVIVDGKEIAHFPDNLCECPEDAIWCRDIQTIFYAGVKAGRITKDDSEIKIEELDEY